MKFGLLCPANELRRGILLDVRWHVESVEGSLQ